MLAKHYRDLTKGTDFLRGPAAFGTNASTLELMRFFSATAYAGRLYLQGVGEKGPWDPRALICWDESQIDYILNPRIGDRKALTVSEVRRAVAESALRGRPALKVWLREGLEDEAREHWQAGIAENSHVTRRRPDLA